ncbi:hypothetical protein FRC14_007668 [Serendipita sp. 396]|nr:hypothetical protein FRC14_007668 [Serendipita sp. 396]KAG8777400.1 hypothetical protein FRC15_011374 [Serendipita sp. 397]KAG8816875.1 hypothetical protein FRC19_011750 [Serendipita sp. 401]KAG8846921.1 hypothetical protein FRB91_000347 [Serendipita sp. 411]KAG8867575.1 hypothetical protein FRC20_005408 [Serendipita sp. 405]KAG9051887.1 hypothetical protein FS842_010865 [Serendipita sp. 407]
MPQSINAAMNFDPFAPLPSPPPLYYRSIAAPFSGYDLETLRAMRTSCGMYADRIPRWSQEVMQDKRRMYFIYLSDPIYTPNAVPIGMVSLLLYNCDDPTLASYANTGRVEVSSLFVYQAYRHLGVGLSAMLEMERRAADIGALFITLNTMATPKNLHLYSQLGYREFKPRLASGYSAQDIMGSGVPTTESAACFMEKPLR